ncbi:MULTISPECIES: two-component system response regulator [Roseiflexus]|uniref:Response regulator receiver protein n=1 Tax=Roseiflexus castenholzii (strain DSM 13941 / HLO8) TaxID=383372 RepID=A7NHA2_ROSCS|nr:MULTISPECIES: response regulator [Roseiflexus]ABU56849.1 response regulator receiver protein [Roseiflexus castenholzii DSM 13941]GIV99655.1 MAG: hypothetical protein KatS3mg058_1059 [Roseiflexus sp.]
MNPDCAYLLEAHERFLYVAPNAVVVLMMYPSLLPVYKALGAMNDDGCDNIWADRRRAMKEVRQGRILVVEEDYDLGRLFEAMLSIEGYHVTVTRHPDEAHRLLPQLEPNLIVFDWSFHNTRGYVWIDELRTSNHTAHIPVLLVCGAPPPRSIYEMLANAGVPIIEKPFDLIAFNRCIAALMHSRERAIGA